MKIKKGQIIAITNGSYSDYCLRDHVVAVRDFDSQEEAERFKKHGDYLDEKGYEWDSDIRFLAWAIREELIEPLAEGTVVELWIGDGRLNMWA